MIIDEVSIHIEGGKGGNGAISFRREKYLPRGGPDGGNGGKGGDVYLTAVSDLSALRQFNHKPMIKAQDGVHGLPKKKTGKNGKDINLNIPIGTIVTETLTGKQWDFSQPGQTLRICSGGKGGRGNFEFRSNKIKAPRFAEDGHDGQKKLIHFNLQFIADVGFIGLPSAGKSSLLNMLTKADVKVGDYPFTTTHANLGELNGLIIADIPGLIEGAHEGKGLGIKFLKHIHKTKTLLHCIDISNEQILHDYEVIRSELKEYSPTLTNKDEVILLTKTDLVDEKKQQEVKKVFSSLKKTVLLVSIHSPKSIQHLKKHFLSQIKKEK
ncbi:hypothetical protein A2957_01025 [Candidatus Roizmanbacteria bacterium RIFCSPLOWO2_01_FULL_38_11]|uniref:GTPase Obg n=1 Tax=Candidatus Roizmanbacteria bacterium RIFCSPLOWO2_01_FULL_38_11 TaxID=1802060 RepID=A0A1F7IN34_9BACT|nr:MAG: hypothetical protein A2957_01025 [Candidatus Roizmanbacteria bacterium RIFCSPLOWO2_01_FULL_38_11]